MMRLIALFSMGFSLSYRWVDVWRFMDCLYVSPLPAPTQCGGRRAVYALYIGANIYRIMKEEYGSPVRHFAALQRVSRIRPLAISMTYSSTSGLLNAGQRESCHIATKRSPSDTCHYRLKLLSCCAHSDVRVSKAYLTRTLTLRMRDPFGGPLLYAVIYFLRHTAWVSPRNILNRNDLWSKSVIPRKETNPFEQKQSR